MHLILANQTLVLLPESAVLITSTSVPTLILADVHLGKAATFRARGLPIPEGDDARDLDRIAALVKTHRPGQLIIAGDLFHSPAGLTPELANLIELFLHQIAIPTLLVTGNHDAKLKRLPSGLTTTAAHDLGGLQVIHDPAHVPPGQPSLCGHWHPVLRIPEGKRSSLRLPCFLLRNQTLVLPAFGGFTGGAVIQPEPGDQCFAPLRDTVVPIPPDLLRPRTAGFSRRIRKESTK